ncbi:MAG TPA: hypothetical protein VLX30_09150 [Burkholderiales bacterium]|nr:hypothetical protein [Burkholderiales bacterium]
MQARAISFAIVIVMALLAAATPAWAAEVSVLKPASEETIHSNQGKLTVKLRRAQGVPGGGMRLVLDGIPLPHIYRSDTIELQGIDRGTHTLQAVLLDPKGERIAASAPITFYLWRASRLLPDRK